MAALEVCWKNIGIDRFVFYLCIRFLKAAP
jgi:hypothetical protein